MDKEREKEEGKVEDEEVILIKPYEVSTATTSSTSQMSFITEEVEILANIWNLYKHQHRQEYSDHHPIINHSSPEENKILYSEKK